jgi:predicted RNA-binding Zn ribbon-like protein
MSKAAQQDRATGSALSGNEAQSPNDSLALALVNTETLSRGKKHDELTSPGALARWWEEMRARYPDQCSVEGAREPAAWTKGLLDAVKVLRAALRTLVTQVVEQHEVQAEDLRPLNEILALGFTTLEPTTEGHVKASVHLRDSRKGSVLFPIALSAVRVLAEADWERLHQCKSDRCIVLFYDTTKSGTRRWCSPGCMNRARSIQHYHQTKGSVIRADAGG